MADWVVISSLATAGGTLGLAATPIVPIEESAGIAGEAVGFRSSVD